MLTLSFRNILVLLLLNNLQDSLIVNGNIKLKYEPNWDSLDKRPLPKWYDEAKIGIFLHWGVYAVPSFGSEWFWHVWDTKLPQFVKFMEKNYPPEFSYQEFAKDFKAQFFNADEWADLFKKSGAKYIVLTSKHHDGYTLWPSTYSYSWNAKDIGPRRDLIDELSKAIKKKNLTFGVYYSLYEWFNPMYLADAKSSFKRKDFVLHKVIPEMKELINTYQPWILWSDGAVKASDTYWGSTEFLAWLYNESPVKENVVVNDRWGNDTAWKHGGFYNGKDRYNPGVLQNHKWENAMSIDKRSWGFRRNAKLWEIYTTHQLIQSVVETVSCGGNILINVGPTKDGEITPIYQERLLDLGKWLSINGEAIYGTKPWTVQKEALTPGVWYTSKDKTVYAIILNWPKSNTLALKSPIELFVGSRTTISLLGYKLKLTWTNTSGAIQIKFPDKASITGEWAWVLKIVK